ncbi:hypothetical protein [uncultured Methanomethylovorans sp.]|uniref:hypothetical protein n=1 Tax=uncultured Methanomethylovorans sp. TaxID=183759 RepID=UPI002AA95A5D|nr:hypothetical protein [uncultured Methanomethylovorans sp.]
MNKILKYGLVVVGILLLFVVGTLSFYTIAPIPNTGPAQGTISENDIKNDEIIPSEATSSHDEEEALSNKTTITISASLVYLNFTQLNQQSELIINGTVKEILPSKWNTPDGKRRGNAIEDIPENDTMYTDIIIKVDQCLKGSLEDQEIRVRTMGGKDEIVRIDYEDEPSFKENEQVLLYLHNDTNPGLENIDSNYYYITGAMLGKFTLTDDRLAIREYEYVNQTELLDSINKGYEPTIKGIEEM